MSVLEDWFKLTSLMGFLNGCDRKLEGTKNELYFKLYISFMSTYQSLMSYGHIFETCVYSLTRFPFLVTVISVSPITVNCLRRGCGSKRKTRMHLVIGGGYVSIEKLVPLLANIVCAIS